MIAFLTVASGIGWSIVYIELIRKGIKDKACGIPLFALALNIAWEYIYAIDCIMRRRNDLQEAAIIAWALLDTVILIIFFKYGRQYLPDNAKKYFIPYTVLAVAACTAIQLAFYFEFTPQDVFYAARYSAYAQNVAMSILFMTQLFRQGNTKGQSVLMAICKWIGTVAPAVQHGIVQEFNIYVVITGVLCTVFDLIYIVSLVKMKNQEHLKGNWLVR